ncbi:hypothetical protein PR202_ga25667 [Eleusine coracana subsp. coracana]|uniref:F-box domain-containing protein n=1 Tax=Eleusine coracana subsp. coracana TaxID=191504 RepID=A0AAV5DBK1_ELECO|nr:hypothetical protein PR202_ga25667 [Eleusine coracana subsp. coracana]
MMDTARELSDDVLVDVLRRLPPRSLAMSRCVSRAWRDVMDTRQLLRTDLLPLSVRGIFMEYCLLSDTVYFARPSTGPDISGSLDFVSEGGRVLDHRNGVLLYKDDGVYFVVNPATRQYTQLPPWPPLVVAATLV